MRAVSQFCLTFLFNACWQLVVIAAIANLGGWLLRGTKARYQHWLCVAALFLLVIVPALSAVRSIDESEERRLSSPAEAVAPFPGPAILPLSESHDLSNFVKDASILPVSEVLAMTLLSFYLLFVAFRLASLFRALWATRRLRRQAHTSEFSRSVHEIVDLYCGLLNLTNVQVLVSDSVSVPITIGIFRPMILLPKKLLSDPDIDSIKSALAHELIHVSRRDYLLNLVYELTFLSISFHPAAALVRRRINQTRELVCDELVADKLMEAQVYARSLLKLIGSVAPFGRPAITVGISDADILEVRIMSLMTKAKLRSKQNLFLMVSVIILLIVPCVAAASFAFRLKIDRQAPNQEPSQEQAEKAARQKREREVVEMREREIQELKNSIANETNPEAKAKLEDALKRRLAETDMAVTVLGRDGQRVITVNKYGAENEERERAQEKMELARQARISMEQAIQIATSLQPGKVLESELIGEHWEAPGKLAADSRVLYRVVILAAEPPNPTTYNVLINALDGAVVRAGKAEPRQENLLTTHAPIEGGLLNGKAISLKVPEYPAIARNAHAEGAVNVRVLIDENGNVVEARALSGHPLLQAAAVDAARASRFAPTRLNGEPVKVSGLIVYNFLVQ